MNLNEFKIYLKLKCVKFIVSDDSLYYFKKYVISHSTVYYSDPLFMIRTNNFIFIKTTRNYTEILELINE